MEREPRKAPTVGDRRSATKSPAAAKGGAWSYDPATGVARLSRGARALLRLPEGEPASDLIASLHVDPVAADEARAALGECVRNGADFDLRLRRSGGAQALRMIGGATADADGATRRIVGVLVESDGEEQLAEEVVATAAHLRSILETALDGVIVIDDLRRIQSFNSAAQRMFGYSEAEAVGRNVNMLMSDGDRSRHDDYISRYISTGERRIIGVGRIVTGLRKDGSQFPLHLSIGETRVEGRRLFTGFVHDLTEARRSESRTQALQTELAHISRLSALGEMGSALAHELNQPLAAIGNYITGSRRLLAEAGGPASAKVETALGRAGEQVLRAGQIIRRLRDFVSRRASERRPESLAKLVEEASALGLVGAREMGVTLKYQLDPRYDAIFVDRVQVEQVLVNLMRNALDAMATVGRRDLTLSSRLAAPGCLEVAVSDTGAGISTEAMARLFEPFYTTKAAGLGVGLSISRGIVEAQGGELRAENNEGGGATFRFTLPLAGTEAP